MAETSGQAGKSERVLEAAVPLSQSVIWRLQSDYYARRGLKAWTEDRVPSYITNNPFIAEIYAGIVAAFVDDCLADGGSLPVSPKNPLGILELGAGTGKFAYLFLRRLMPLLAERNLPPQTVRYAMSDCSEELLAYWRSNQYLAEFTSSGVLEFELLRAGDQAAPAKPGSAPLVVVANYVFDSLPQDAFVVQDGQISEALVAASGGAAEDAPSLSDVRLSFTNAPLPPLRYAVPVWNNILEEYRERLPAATIFFPSAALALLQQLRGLSDGRMLVLAGDKGFAHEEELALTRGTPSLEFHGSGSCFSTMVNLHAISRLYAATGGLALLPPKHFTTLNLCAFIARRPEAEFPRTCKAYAQALEAFGPDDLFTLMGWLSAYLENVSLSQALSILRLTRWDTTAFQRLFPVIAPRLRNIGAERNDLRDAVLRVWENRYPVEAGDNSLAFECAVVLLELKFYIEAAAMFEASATLLGSTAATSYNLGLCALGFNDRAAALAHMTEACRLDPAFEPARKSRERLEKELQQG
ncbi:MAG TPA: SAM-dependent methyltransferase [Candidatus Angelobacter sp.]|nr:SAM-dependent methyltransferase [Candidatus Angelobacter sp.]